MNAKENNDLSEIQQYVMHLRYKLANYWLYRIDPPEYLLDELKTAECLARIELRECEKLRQQVEI
jgi:hypothetical protein